MRICASTGSPSGPVTVVERVDPPRAASRASRVPSPPSASGIRRAVSPAASSPAAMASAASAAVSDPRNLSGATMARATVDRLHRVPERVPLLEKDLGEYVPIVGAEVVERIQALAAPLRG